MLQITSIISGAVQEKRELQELNNRLAAYINSVKHLEIENSRLTQEIRSLEETATREVSNVKSLFGSELDDLRNALDREAKQNNLLELESRRKTLEIEELKTQLYKVNKDLKEATPYIARFNELNNKYDQILIDNINLKDNCKVLIKEISEKKKNLKDAQKTLEENILLRVIAENNLQSLRETFKFKEEVYEQQLNDARTNRRTEIIFEVQGRLIKEYEDKLQSELQLLRQQGEENVKYNKLEISELFESKFQNLEKELQHEKKAVEWAIEDVKVANARVNELTQQINDLLASNNEYLNKIRDLEKLKEYQRIKYQSEIEGLDQQLTAIQDDMSQKVLEYQELMNIKVVQDMKIAACRILLESEEKRSSITPYTSFIGSPRGEKRKLFHCDETKYEYSNFINASSMGDIEISEVCSDGQFVKLYNKGAKEIRLNGYELVRTAVLKFHHTVKLGAGDTLAIWSSTASNQIHEPSAGSIKNTQDWVVGDLITTIVLNAEGQEIATHKLKKGQAFLSRTNIEYGDIKSELFHPSDDSLFGDKCVIM